MTAQMLMEQLAKCIVLTVLKKGEFKNPGPTNTKMQEFVEGKMKEKGFSGFLAGFFLKKNP